LAAETRQQSASRETTQSRQICEHFESVPLTVVGCILVIDCREYFYMYLQEHVLKSFGVFNMFPTYWDKCRRNVS